MEYGESEGWNMLKRKEKEEEEEGGGRLSKI